MALAKKTLEAASDLDIRLLALDLGPAGLKTSEAQLRLRFARREMDEDEPGGRLLKRALEERRSRAGRIFDACRLALEPLLEAAARAGRRPGPAAGPHPLAAAQPAGGPAAAAGVHRRSAAAAGLSRPPGGAARAGAGRPGRALARSSRRTAGCVLATDQVGLDSDLLLGEGELDDDDLRLPKLAEGTPTIVVSGPVDASFKEVRRARLRLEALPAPPPEPASGSRLGRACDSSSVSCLVMPLRMLPAMRGQQQPQLDVHVQARGLDRHLGVQPLARHHQVLVGASPSHLQAAP